MDNEEQPFILQQKVKEGNEPRIYKVYKVNYKPYLLTRLKTPKLNDLYLNNDGKEDTFTVESLAGILNDYDKILSDETTKSVGGKKSRKNRKHKTKSAKKRRTARKYAY